MNAISAQPIASSRAAVCVVPKGNAAPVLPDTAEITGVIVRLTSNPTGRPSDAHLAKALSVLTAEQLQSLVEAPVRSRYDVAPSPVAQKTIAAVAEGRVLGLRWVVTGRVVRSADSVQVSWELLDSFSGKVAGSGNARAKFVQLDELSGKLSSDIARAIGIAVPSANPPPSVLNPPSIAAFELYLAGLYPYDSFVPSEQRDAIVMLQQVVAMEPGLRAAWLALAEANTRLVEWGEGGSAYGREDRSASALAAANRALALAPRDVRTLALLAHVHLLRDEPIAAAQVLNAIRSIASASDDISWLMMELALVRGHAREIELAMSANTQQQLRSPRALYFRAEHERRRGELVDACQSLNRLLVLEPTWAPGFVQRALVRTALGDRRGGWQDAEMASRLGQPVWGDMVSALIDFSVSDSLRTRTKLLRLSVIVPETVLPTLDVMLRGAVRRAMGQNDRALRVLEVAPCDDPRRRFFRTEPLLRGLTIPTACRTSAKPTALSVKRGS